MWRNEISRSRKGNGRNVRNIVRPKGKRTQTITEGTATIAVQLVSIDGLFVNNVVTSRILTANESFSSHCLTWRFSVNISLRLACSTSFLFQCMLPVESTFVFPPLLQTYRNPLTFLYGLWLKNSINQKFPN